MFARDILDRCWLNLAFIKVSYLFDKYLPEINDHCAVLMDKLIMNVSETWKLSLSEDELNGSNGTDALTIISKCYGILKLSKQMLPMIWLKEEKRWGGW